MIKKYIFDRSNVLLGFILFVMIQCLFVQDIYWNNYLFPQTTTMFVIFASLSLIGVSYEFKERIGVALFVIAIYSLRYLREYAPVNFPGNTIFILSMTGFFILTLIIRRDASFRKLRMGIGLGLLLIYIALSLYLPTTRVFPDLNMQKAVRYDVYDSSYVIKEGDIKKVRELDIDGEHIRSYEGIRYASNLQHLSISDIDSMTGLEELGELKNLKELRFVFVESLDLTAIPILPNIEYIRIYDIPKGRLTDFNKQTSLKELNIEGDMDTSLEEIKDLTKLEDMDLGGFSFNESSVSLKGIENLTSLRRLRLRYLNIKDASELLKSESIKEILIDGCSYELSDDVVKTLRSRGVAVSIKNSR